MAQAGIIRSVDATLVQPYAVGPVKLLHVLEVPRGQELEQRAEVNEVFVVQLFQGCIKLCQQVFVCGFMFIRAGKALP
jgi:hypothetical protein